MAISRQGTKVLTLLLIIELMRFGLVVVWAMVLAGRSWGVLLLVFIVCVSVGAAATGLSSFIKAMAFRRNELRSQFLIDA